MKAKVVGICLTGLAMVAAVSLGAASAASNDPENSTPQQVFDGMRQSFQAQKAKGVHARYQWELSGRNGGQWWTDVNEGPYKMGKGKMANPSATFITSNNSWVTITNGELKRTGPYFT